MLEQVFAIRRDFQKIRDGASELCYQVKEAYDDEFDLDFLCFVWEEAGLIRHIAKKILKALIPVAHMTTQAELNFEDFVNSKEKAKAEAEVLLQVFATSDNIRWIAGANGVTDNRDHTCVSACTETIAGALEIENLVFTCAWQKSLSARKQSECETDLITRQLRTFGEVRKVVLDCASGINGEGVEDFDFEVHAGHFDLVMVERATKSIQQLAEKILGHHEAYPGAEMLDHEHKVSPIFGAILDAVEEGMLLKAAGSDNVAAWSKIFHATCRVEELLKLRKEWTRIALVDAELASTVSGSQVAAAATVHGNLQLASRVMYTWERKYHCF